MYSILCIFWGFYLYNNINMLLLVAKERLVVSYIDYVHHRFLIELNY